MLWSTLRPISIAYEKLKLGRCTGHGHFKLQLATVLGAFECAVMPIHKGKTAENPNLLVRLSSLESLVALWMGDDTRIQSFGTGPFLSSDNVPLSRCCSSYNVSKRTLGISQSKGNRNLQTTNEKNEEMKY